ncbi:NHL repeat-containing protein [Marinobacterium jannaschii]|uniref:hypothetical protein n=1 Tax=Marinobacterium jannaschii TaxID=64970 RepID=UPI00068504E3|nr:hypothetical protein [Marinobacterium jannaschii]
MYTSLTNGLPHPSLSKLNLPKLRNLMLGGALMLNAATALAAEKLWQIDNLHQPESVVAGPAGQVIYISNINGNPIELNGKGYISRATVDGELTEQYWIEGLDAPKGMAIVNGQLYIADMQRVHIVDIASGKVIRQLTAPDAQMLNDITASPDGTVYVSDLLGGAIYRIRQDRLESWFRSAQVPHPNGLLWHKGAMLVAGWGSPLRQDFTTQTPGSLYRLDIDNQALTPVASGYQLGNLDGIVARKDSLYISDWISGELFRLRGKERHRLIAPGAGLADIGLSGTTLFAPMMMDNRVVAWQTDKE